jgi:trigger factor
MEVQIETVGPCKKKLALTIPVERVARELDEKYKELANTVTVPGFRKGHVPRRLMESRFGKEVNGDARDSLMSECFEKAVEDNELKVIGSPSFDEDLELKPGEPFEFAVTVEVRPDFEIEGYKGLEIERPSTEPTEEEIDAQVQAHRRRYSSLDEITEGAPQPEDVVLGRVELRHDGSVYREIPNHQFIVGDHVLVGMDLDQTTEFVTSATVGETAERTVTLPDAYPDADKRGAEMTLALTIEKIQRPVLPELTDEWLDEQGFDSAEEFREEMAGQVRREKTRRVDALMEERMLDALLAKADFELPEDIVNDMAERQLVRRSLFLRYQGMPPEKIEQRLDELRKESRETAARNAKIYFMLEKIADAEKLFVTEDEVDARVDAMARAEGREVEQVRRDLEQNERLAELRSQMREEKIKSFLFDKANIRDRGAAGEPAADASAEGAAAESEAPAEEAPAEAESAGAGGGADEGEGDGG